MNVENDPKIKNGIDDARRRLEVAKTNLETVEEQHGRALYLGIHAEDIDEWGKRLKAARHEFEEAKAELEKLKNDNS